MLFNSECRRREALHVVTGCALPFIGALDELPIVLVLVTVKTVLESQRLLEITRRVAAETVHRLVLALQGIFGFRMIKALVHGLQRNSLPAKGVMARLASLLRETAVMRIGVAIGTSLEGQADVPGLVVGSRRVTLRARHLRVQSRQRIPGLVVVELRDILPVFEIVALLTVLPQPSLVLVLVTVHAIGRNSQKRPGFVANLNRKQLALRDVGGRVAAVAGQSRMLPQQVVTGLAVIETGRSGCPFNDFEIFAVVLGVAPGALLAGIGLEVIRGVQAPPRSQPRRDLGMALDALQCARRAQLVTGRAIGCAVQCFMRA